MTASPLARRAIARVAAASAIAGAAILVLVASAPDPRPLLAKGPASSIEVADRDGRMLRCLPDGDGVRAFPVRLDRISPYLLAAVLAAEDRRFYSHPGVDPIAAARALAQAVRRGRVVSGGSTITMQLARILDPRARGISSKLRQAALAVRLETAASKDAILEAYLSRAPMGNRIVGFEAASRLYLGKPASQLSPAESALLAAIPRAPSATNPRRGLEILRARRDAILRRMAASGGLGPVPLVAALAEPVVLSDRPFRSEAAAFVERVLDEAGPLPPGAVRVVGTLDPELQRRVETIARRMKEKLAEQGVGHLSVAVLDPARGEWLALAGESRSPRQPGSALKPFTYAAAFDRGLSAASILPDLPRSFVDASGTWTPRNYDARFHGPLRARQALACSVNVPAAIVLESIGVRTLLEVSRRAGITTLTMPADYYGLGLTLGAGEVRLDELVAAYAALLRGGAWRPPTAWRRVESGDGGVLARPHVPDPVRIVSPAAAALVTDILSDPDARAPAFGAWSVLRLPFAAAVKTGTSEGFRDNWCVGGTREVVVGVWCGNLDRTPMGNVSGVAGAGTVWREVMLAWAELYRRGADPGRVDTLGPLPEDLRRARICALSGGAPGTACPRTVVELFRADEAPPRACDWHSRGPGGRVALAWPPAFRTWAASRADEDAPVEALEAPVPIVAGPPSSEPLRITAPADGDAFLLAPDLPRRFQTVELRCSVPGLPADVVWRVDGIELARPATPYLATWTLEPGVHVIDVVAGGVRSRPVRVTVHGGGPIPADG